MSLLDKATIITTPTAHSNGILHSIKGGSVADFDVVRGSVATRVNAEGLIEDIATNIPRIDYADGTASILLEPQSTNLVPYSEDFPQWTAGSDLALSNSFLAPDGTNTAYKVTKTGASQPYLTNNLGLTATTTRSIYARTVSGTGTAALLSHNSNTNNTFTLTEQWQRFELSDTASSSGLTTFYAADFRGSGTLTEYIIWGANATNDQDYATSYIPTNGAIATRLADSVTGAGDATTFNSTEGVLYFEGSALTNGKDSRISLSDGSLLNRVSFAYAPTANQAYCIVRFNGVQVIQDLNVSLGGSQTDNIKVAIRYKSGDSKMFINGVSVESSSVTYSAASPPLSELKFENSTGGVEFEGKVKSLITFNTALTDAELECLTTI